MAQAQSARAMKARKEKTRIHNLPYGLSRFRSGDSVDCKWRSCNSDYVCTDRSVLSTCRNFGRVFACICYQIVFVYTSVICVKHKLSATNREEHRHIFQTDISAILTVHSNPYQTRDLNVLIVSPQTPSLLGPNPQSYTATLLPL